MIPQDCIISAYENRILALIDHKLLLVLAQMKILTGFASVKFRSVYQTPSIIIILQNADTLFLKCFKY